MALPGGRDLRAAHWEWLWAWAERGAPQLRSITIDAGIADVLPSFEVIRARLQRSRPGLRLACDAPEPAPDDLRG